MTSILFVLDEALPVQSAPAVRIRNFIEAIPSHSVELVGGSKATDQAADPAATPGTFLSRPSERRPLVFGLFLLRLGITSVFRARKLRPDILVLSVPKYELLLFAPLLKRYSKRLILDLRDSFGFLDYDAYLSHFLPAVLASPLARLIKLLISRLLSHALRIADVITAANKGIQASLPEYTVTVLPNGVDTTKFFPLPHTEQTSRRKVKVVYLGNFAEKDQFEFFYSLSPAHAAGIELHLFGAGRIKESVLASLAMTNISVTDHGIVDHDKLPTMLPLMDLGIIFRKEGVNESIPVCLFEFAACGVPCCCSDTGIMADFVRDHQIGYVVTSSRGFGDIIDTLQQKPDTMRASQLHATAENHFSLAHTRKLFARLINENRNSTGDFHESNYPDPVLQ